MGRTRTKARLNNIHPKANATPGIPSQKSVNKVFFKLDRSLEALQGRHRVAQGVSPGLDGPHPAFGTPLPRSGRGDGGEGGALATHGLRRGLLAVARSAG